MSTYSDFMWSKPNRVRYWELSIDDRKEKTVMWKGIHKEVDYAPSPYLVHNEIHEPGWLGVFE